MQHALCQAQGSSQATTVRIFSDHASEYTCVFVLSGTHVSLQDPVFTPSGSAGSVQTRNLIYKDSEKPVSDELLMGA